MKFAFGFGVWSCQDLRFLLLFLYRWWFVSSCFDSDLFLHFSLIIGLQNLLGERALFEFLSMCFVSVLVRGDFRVFILFAGRNRVVDLKVWVFFLALSLLWLLEKVKSLSFSRSGFRCFCKSWPDSETRVFLLCFWFNVPGLEEALFTELWHACAGPLVTVPREGERVFYFPQGHIEQVILLNSLLDFMLSCDFSWCICVSYLILVVLFR